MKKESEKKTVSKSEEKKPTVKKLPMKEFVLIRDVVIGKTLKKKGEKVKLTEKGRVFFKQNKYIK